MISRRGIVYELRIIVGNLFINLFGVCLPIFLATVISSILVSEYDLSGEILQNAKTAVYLGYGMIIPLATVLMGCSVTQANEIEKNITERMYLFGITFKEIILNRLIAELFYISVAFMIFFGVGAATGAVVRPDIRGCISYILIVLSFTAILFLLSYGIATLCRTFSLTYFVAMALYFFVMISCGLMGFSDDELPAFMGYANDMIPVTYVYDEDFIKAWLWDGYNFGPLLQSVIFMAAVSGIVIIIARRSRGRAAR